jgi:hypothetical protein
MCPPPKQEEVKIETKAKGGLVSRAKFFEQQVAEQNKNEKEVEALKQKLALERTRKEEEAAVVAAAKAKEEEAARRRAEFMARNKNQFEQH